MDLSWLPSLTLYLAGILVLAATFRRQLKGSKLLKKESWKDVLEKEHQSQFIRNKDLPDDFFILVDFKSFPTVNDEECQKLYLSLLRFAQRPMVNLKGKNNLDLKTNYGPQVIELVSNYERNYFEFMDILFKYGKILYEKLYIEEAKLTLEQGIKYHCDLSKCYLLLIKIYQQQKDINALAELEVTVKTEMHDSPLLNKVLRAF